MKTTTAQISRRNFLTVSGAAAAFLAAQTAKTTAFAELATSESVPQKKKYPIGLEALFSERRTRPRSAEHAPHGGEDGL